MAFSKVFSLKLLNDPVPITKGFSISETTVENSMPSKALLPIEVTLLGIIIEFKPVHP